MEPPNEPTQASPKPEFLWLPKECIFTMQQWLYRRTLHTKRYKKRYVVLHNERLYTFTKLPPFDKFDLNNINSVLRSASNSWILTGSVVSADTDVNTGLFKWKIEFKNYKKPVTAIENINKFLTDKPDLTVGNVDHIDCIFEDVTSSVLENKTVNVEAQDCLWFATTNHKIASDWLIALLYTSRYGSLYNLIYKNPSRRRFQQFTLPWFLMALDYLPNLSKDENSKPPLSSFTYIKIEIKRVFDFPMLPNAKIYCAVEFNSSFYIIQLYRYERENHTETPSAMAREDEPSSSLTAYISRNSERSICRIPSDDLSVVQLNDRKNSLQHDECSQPNYYKTNAQFATLEGGIKFNATVQSLAPSNTSVPNSVAGPPDDDPQNVITRLLNLNSNKDIKKKQVVEKRSIKYDGASVYIPVYKNSTQEIVWLHFFGDYDVYMGTASIRDVDFASRDPAPVKTCMIKLIEGLNPLHYKRVDVSNYKGESTVLKSSARSISNDRGFVELSVIIPKHLGNFLDPVVISHGSPKEYLSNASRSSISIGIQMLIANIKRVRQSFTVLKDIIHSLKSILEFRSMFTSFTAMLYFILVFGIFPNRMLVIFLLPILSYIVCTHPRFIDLTFLFLLKFPILIAILPKRFTYPFLLMPKLSCILCSKKPSFLKQNTQVVDPDMVSKEEISSKTFQYSSNKKLPKSMYLNQTSSETEVIVNPFSAANATQVNTDPNRKREMPQESYDEANVLNQPTYVDFEKRISVHINSLPMITSKHLLNDSIEITRYKGTRIETCKHRGIIMSYLSVMFINEMGVELFDSVHGDGLAIIKGYHDIYYNIPPYRNVPFWPNVKFTLYFLFYMFFLTFFGGISNLQILHLLHRNKLICRLILESKGVVESKPKGQHHQTKQRNVSLYENERRILFGKFSKLNLRFYERGYFSTEDGQFVSVDLSKYLVRLVVNDNTDQEGWTYAKNWNSPFTNSPNSMTFVRRRKWMLTPNDSKNIEYILKSRFPSKLSSDYFVNMKHGLKNDPENDCLSLTSEDSSRTPKLTTSNVKNNSNEEESDNKKDLADRAEQQLQDGENSKTSVKPSDTNHDISTIDDENIARLYFRKGKVKRLVDRIRDARERRKSQKQDNSNMQEYLKSLVANIPPDKIGEIGNQKQPKRSRILPSLKKSKYSESTNLSTERGTNHINSLLQENDSETKSYSGLRFREKSESPRPTSSDRQNEHDGNDLLTSLMNLNQNESSQTISESDILLPSTLTLNLNEETTPQFPTLNDNLHFDANYMKSRPPKVTALRKLYKMAKPLEKDLKLQEHSNSRQSTSKIARLVNYLTYLHNPDETPSSDRTAYSTISQFSTNSQGVKKSMIRRVFETMFAILFALPICILLDLGKLVVGFFWLLLRTVLGIPEPVEERQPTLTKQRVFKFRAVCRLAITEENKLYFRLVRPRRCFMLGERLKIFKRICYAENMYFVHNLNKLMIDSNRKYGSESDISSDEESVGSLMQIRESLEKSFSNQYLDDSDTLPESDIETINRNEMTSDDDLEDLRTFSMNPFDLDESDEEILNMMRKSYDSAENGAVRKIKKKKGKIANYISGIYSKRMARKGKYVDEQHLSDYEQDSDENIETGSKIGVIGMLKKVKDQIVMANYKINLYNMRFEKFLNMFSWKNYSVTTIVLFLLILIIVINMFFSIEIIMLAYILYQFKAGYKRGTWERMVLSTTKRHISKAIVELEIFRPFWDLSTHQIQVLSNRIKAFSSIELEINTIREAKDETYLAYIISDQLVSGKFARNWKRHRWINNLFRQAPCKQY